MNNAAPQRDAADNDMLLQAQDLCKAYASNGTQTHVLNQVNMGFNRALEYLLSVMSDSDTGLCVQ